MVPEQSAEPDAASAPGGVHSASAETGRVKWFSVARKYGFITPDGGGQDVFVHISALIAAAIPFLDDGTRVSYELTQGTDRLSAVGLRILEPGSDT